MLTWYTWISYCRVICCVTAPPSGQVHLSADFNKMHRINDKRPILRLCLLKMFPYDLRQLHVVLKLLSCIFRLNPMLIEQNHFRMEGRKYAVFLLYGSVKVRRSHMTSKRRLTLNVISAVFRTSNALLLFHRP